MPGRLVHRKYTTNYVFCGGKKLKHSFITIRKKTYYFDKSGDMHKGWLKLAGQYYYLDRASGVMVHQGKVDGIRLRKVMRCKSRLNVRKDRHDAHGGKGRSKDHKAVGYDGAKRK